MNNEDVAWVIVRAFGIYFLAQAFLDVLSVFTYATNLIELHGQASGLADSDERLWRVESYIVSAKVNLGMGVLESAAFALGAFYCLRRGRLIHKLLTYRSSSNEKT